MKPSDWPPKSPTRRNVETLRGVLTPAEIARKLGITRQAVNRHLREIEREERGNA
jgi:predicted transcriptional regulator